MSKGGGPVGAGLEGAGAGAVGRGGSPPKRRRLLGVVLAGGDARRFGGGKALEPLGGRPMAAWALEALAPHVVLAVTVANDPAVARTLGVPGRPDRVPGLGPLGGLATALWWAHEEGLEGAFVLACDLPLVGEELVGAILGRWPEGTAAVVPESPGSGGFEPLCAAFSVECLPAVEARLASGRRSMKGLAEAVEAWRVPAGDLAEPEALALALTNVNTRAEAARAEALLGRRAESKDAMRGAGARGEGNTHSRWGKGERP